MASVLQPADPADIRIAELERQVAKLTRINNSLMDRVERSTDLQGNAFSLFETAISLEAKVRERTADLERALNDLAASSAAIAHAKEAAEHAQRRLADAIESINEGFAIFDAEDRLVLCNQTYLGLWSNIADRIRPGMTFQDIARLIGDDGTTLGALVAPDRWISERVAQHRVAAGGHVHALADGRWIQINELHTSEGGIVGVYTDITQVKADDARERTRELAVKSAILQSTLDNIRLGVCVYDSDRRLIAWNGPLLSTIGLPDDGLALVMTHESLVETCVRLNGPMNRNRALDWLPPGSPDVVAKRRHNSGRIVEIRRSSMPDGGMVMSFEDITERLLAADALRETNETLERRVRERTADIEAVNTELQQQIVERLSAEEAMREAKTAAEQANISKTRFLAAASHDLLQPLNAARLFVAALDERRLALPTRALVRQTGSALDSVEDLLEALLEISKLDAGAITPEIGDVSLAELFRAMRAEFTPVAHARRIALDVPTTDLWVRSDPRLLRRVVQNLLSNALRYTEQGSVTLSAACKRGSICIAVRDTGPGIDPAHHEAIFEEFRRFDSGRVQGMGLGLAIVQRASRMLGHPVKVESALGEGSTFCITLLAAAQQAALTAAPVVPARRAVAVRHVLAIDNEPAILQGMAALLEGWGCTVSVAGSSEEAIARISENGAIPDVVIADYHLANDETGVAAIQAVRSATGREIPALIITADRTPELREELHTAGLHMLQKPVKPAQMRALLTRLADGA